MLHSLTHEDRFFFLQCTASAPLFRFFHFSGLAEPSSGLSFHWANLRDMGHNNAINTIVLYYVLIHTLIRGLVRILCADMWSFTPSSYNQGLSASCLFYTDTPPGPPAC